MTFDRYTKGVLTFIAALTVFSIVVVWPGWPKRYLPDFIDWPQGKGLSIGGLERRAMRLGLDLKGGTYVLLEADCTRLPEGTDCGDALDGAENVIDRRVNAFGVSETEITREGRNRLAVQLPGIAPEEARDLIGKTALLEFRQPKLDEARQIMCLGPDGTEFPSDPQLVNQVDLEDRRVAQCTGGGQTGEVVWEPATGTDSQGQTRTLTGRLLKATARAEVPPYCERPPACVIRLVASASAGPSTAMRVISSRR